MNNAFSIVIFSVFAACSCGVVIVTSLRVKKNFQWSLIKRLQLEGEMVRIALQLDAEIAQISLEWGAFRREFNGNTRMRMALSDSDNRASDEISLAIARAQEEMSRSQSKAKECGITHLLESVIRVYGDRVPMLRAFA